MIDRRAFLAGTAAVLLAAPLAVEALETGNTPKIGFLAMGQHPAFSVFAAGLRDLGYIDGQNIVLVLRFAEVGKPEQFDSLAAELVQRKVDVIVALIHPEIVAARRASTQIPIVMVVGVDPVGSGFARSLARPGGNVTGLSWDADPEFSAKSVEILKELLPSLKRIGGLVDPAFPATTGWDAVVRGSISLGIQLLRAEARTPRDLEASFSTLQAGKADAVLVLGGSMLFSTRAEIARLGVKIHVPVMSPYREAVEAGGLISYGPSLPDLWRRSAEYVHKILKGAKPADLPIEQPTKFELVINLKTAKALGLTIPPSVLARADEVIQ